MNILALALLFVLFSAAAQAQTPTHWVSPTGTGSPNVCATQATPCSLARAMALAGGASIPCGSVVLVTAPTQPHSYYNQAQITYGSSLSCPAGTPVTFLGEEGAVLTGLQATACACSYVLTSGLTYTYQIPWNDTTQFRVRVAAQRDPSVFTPIVMEDRAPPFTIEAERQYTLIQPIMYSAKTSIAEVELHRGSFFHDIANDILYVHMLHNGPPATSDDFYVGQLEWGSVRLAGDGLAWDNIDFLHVSTSDGGAMKVSTTGDHNIVRNTTIWGGQLWSHGTNTVLSDLDVGGFVTHGAAAAGCWDRDSGTSGTTARSCWNNGSNAGAAFVLGWTQNTSLSFGQVATRVYVHESWNGALIAGANTIQDSTFWGFHNHTLECSGTGGVIQRNVFVNGQDSLYCALPFDQLTVTRNVFSGGVLFWLSTIHNGTVPTTSWTFTHNILPSLVIEEASSVGLTSDCNLWIPALSGQGPTAIFQSVSNPNYVGQIFGYPTVAAIQAGGTYEAHGVELPYTKWLDGTQFLNFTQPRNRVFDFHPANAAAQAINMPPACASVPGYAGPYQQVGP